MQAEGVEFNLGDPPQKYTFRGTLTLVSGDNLASNFIGGYKQLSSALRKCRFCMAPPQLDHIMDVQFGRVY